MEQKICGACHRVFKEEGDFLTNTSQWRVCTAENLWFNCSCGSTLMLPKGKFPWYSPTLGMSDEAASIFNRIAASKQLPHIPSAVLELQKMLLSPEVEVLDLARSLKKEPLIAGEVLKVASNLRKIRQSANQTQGNESLEYAIAFIGRKSLSNLVSAASIKNFGLKTVHFNQELFWQQAFQTAALAELLATQYSQKVEKDKAYLAGSLCNIGKIVSALYYPEKTDQLQLRVNDVETLSSWPAAEKALGVADHCTLGEIGVAFWGLAPFIGDVVKYHHGPPEGNHEDAELCHIVCLANNLMHWLNLEPHRIEEEQLAAELGYFGMSHAQAEELLKRLS